MYEDNSRLWQGGAIAGLLLLMFLLWVFVLGGQDVIASWSWFDTWLDSSEL